ncbi:MAG TPA: YlqD family protein [Bacillota bacterium]|nr:YlqD family protein [Bacillota bacterium]
MELIQPVRIAHVLTEKSKHELQKSFTQEKLRLEQECEQLLFEQKKLQRQMKEQRVVVEEKFQKEIQTRMDQQQQLDFKLEQLDSLPLGSELVEKEVDALVEVSIGSKWSTIHKQITIVIEDDVIIRIDR